MPAASTTQLESSRAKRLRGLLILAAIAVLFIALTPNLTRFPVTWFDEGSHLHVPKTLVTYGVYADYSSEGFRYYGPTIGVGPTVMLPIAAVFSVFGIGLLQARLVMVLYLAISIVLFYVLARRLGSTRFALVATALLLTSQSVSLIEYGRQVLGEVPALVFMLLGLLAWQPAFTEIKPSLRGWLQLIFVGIMFGLTTITKNQFLLVLAPSLGLSWLVCAVFLRLSQQTVAARQTFAARQTVAALPHRLFLVPLITMMACYGIWQVLIVLSLGPSTVQENFRILRDATAGAAFVFSTDAMRRAGGELLSQRAYGRLVLPALGYAALLAWLLLKPASSKSTTRTWPRGFESNAHFWLVLFIFVGINMVWFVGASIGWVRYAFPGLVLSALFVARLLGDLVNGFGLQWPLNRSTRSTTGQNAARGPTLLMTVLTWGLVAWAVFVVVTNSVGLVQNVAAPPPPAAQNMAAYLDEHVPLTATIETWEPEMGFLTNHRYHFPPNALLSKSVNLMFSQGPDLGGFYNFMENTTGAPPPDYVLQGKFGQWVQVYPQATLDQHYQQVAGFGTYSLYTRVK